MDFKALFFDSSRLVADHAVSVISKDPVKIEALFWFILENHHKYSARAARVFDLLNEKYPERIRPYLEEIIKNLSIKNTSVLRAFLRILFAHVPELNESQFGMLMNLCFNMLANPKLEVSHRVYSMHILYEMYKIEPLIKDELRITIEENLEFGSQGVKNVGKKILKKLK